MPNLFSEFVNRLDDKHLWSHECFKANYVILDIETTGFDFQKNRIVQFGYLLTKNGQSSLENAKCRSIKTQYSPSVWSAVYAGRDEKSKQFLTLIRKANVDVELAKRAIDENDGSILGLQCIPEDIQMLVGKNGQRRFTSPVDVTHIRSSYLENVGVEREQALNEALKIFEYCMNNKWPIVGHNIYNFDLPFIEFEIKHFLNRHFEIDRSLVIDTGAIVKGIQLNSKLGKLSFKDWYDKMNNRRSRVKWTLDDYCYDAYNLAKYGVDNTKQHKNAGYDCFVNDCLIRELIK